MENVTDALFIAFGVLAFVIALSVSIFAFSEVRIASQTIINYNDREANYIYMEPSKTKANRIVTREDIIATLYRVYDEKYIVKFEGIGDLYEIKAENNNNYNYYKTSTINFAAFNVGINGKKFFLEALLKGDKDTIDKLDWANGLPNRSLYDIIGENTFEEHIGIYNTDDNEEDDANKEEKRIITYVKK